MKKLILFLVFPLLVIFPQNQVVKSKAPTVFNKTKPLREMPVFHPGSGFRFEKYWSIPNRDTQFDTTKLNRNARYGWNSEFIQKIMGNQLESASPINNWEGIPNLAGVLPPDTQGDVGPNHYVQMVNLQFQIWDKSGNTVLGPLDNSTLWQDLDPSINSNDGDPIVLYDELADRWLLTQFSLPNGSSTAPFYMMLAISETGDPTGAYFQYAFEFSDFPDYPKFGIWPDGYYMSTVAFASSYRGVDAVVFDRQKMLNGDPTATMQVISLDFSAEPYPVRMLPADFDGTPPPDGTPNYFAHMRDDAWGYTNDHISIWEFSTDWNTPSNTTFTEVSQLSTDPFDYEFTSNLPTGRSDIDQPGTLVGLDALADRLMFCLKYRNFGDYGVMVANHTVDVNGSDLAGIRWYEFRDTGTGWSIHQQGTYSPDSENRWMGSISMDSYGNMALGYSVSSTSTFPSIRYTGRKAGDPLGQMTIAEQTIVSGGGSQTSLFSRWGDYSMMSVDPIDQNTFWFTTEYIESNTEAGWKTKIASFTFGVDLSLKIFIEGAFNLDSLSNQLALEGKLPETQPYNYAPYNYDGAERIYSLDTTPINGIPDIFENGSIVDWILVSLRTSTEKSSEVQKKAALIKTDGSVVALDGISPLRFGVPDGNYYIVVEHRNHLVVMSANTVALSNNTPAAYDFTTGSDKFYGTGGAKELN